MPGKNVEPKRNKTKCSILLTSYFKDYDSYHKTTGNKITHYFGIPIILISLLGLLSRLQFETYVYAIGAADGAHLLLLISFLWYLYLDWKIAFPFIIALYALYYAGRILPLNLSWCLFVLGWILQGVGHYAYEKNSPAFFRNMIHLSIGPLWIFARIFGYYE